MNTGFVKVDMTDHQFAKFLTKIVGKFWRAEPLQEYTIFYGTGYRGALAVIKYNNQASTREIFVAKEHYNGKELRNTNKTRSLR